jgi:transcriptional regulator with XRE-family HTH domain
MTLAQYLAQSGISQRQFAKRAGLSTATVSLLVRGRAPHGNAKPLGVSFDTKNKLKAASLGAINDDDFAVREIIYWWAKS